MRAAFRTLRGMPVTGRRIAVLGAMAELGDLVESEHEALGVAVRENGIDMLLAIGEWGERMALGAGAGVETHVFADYATLAQFLKTHVGPEDLILLKGSRAAQMETVINELSSSV